MVGSLQHKEGRKKREMEGRKEGEGKADGENWNLMFRSPKKTYRWLTNT